LALEQQLSVQVEMEQQQQQHQEQQAQKQQQQQIARMQSLSVGQLRLQPFHDISISSPWRQIAPNTDASDFQGENIGAALSSYATPPHTPAASFAEVFSPPSAGQVFGECPKVPVLSPLTPVSVSPKM
jgi:TolA-binding protein